MLAGASSGDRETSMHLDALLARSESGVGAWLKDVAPERVAARLREVG